MICVDFKALGEDLVKALGKDKISASAKNILLGVLRLVKSGIVENS